MLIVWEAWRANTVPFLPFCVSECLVRWFQLCLWRLMNATAPFFHCQMINVAGTTAREFSKEKRRKKSLNTHSTTWGKKRRNSGRKKNGLEKCTLTKRHTQNPGGFWEFVDIGFFTGTPHISWYLPTEMTINQWHETCGEHSPILPCLIIISIICFKSATVVRLLIFPLSSFFMSS